MNERDREQLAQLVEQQLDGSLTPEEFEQLQRMLMGQRGTRELYLDLLHQDAHLKLESVHLAATGTVSHPEPNEPTQLVRPANKRRLLLSLIVLAASLIITVGWVASLADSRGAPAIAQIIDSSNAQWGDCSLPSAVGSKLIPGRLKIDRGLATIRFASGAQVTLESPAELELETPLAGRLIAGTAVVEVPPSAHGFTLTTPTAVAIDHGTAFAITIDPDSQSSSFEVLEGEVEVRHLVSSVSRRLKQKQRVVASAKELSDSDATDGEITRFRPKSSLASTARTLRITTADGKGEDASVSRLPDEVSKAHPSELVLIKNPYPGFEQFSRKGYFRFDLNSMPRERITSARFLLTVMPSGLGFASKVVDCEFVVYGLTNEAADGWSADDLTWQTAPANVDGAAELDDAQVRALGRFTVPRGVQHGQVWIEGDELVQFLAADTNQSVTLIVVRETQESDPGGLVHGFTTRWTSAGTPPTLIISTAER